MSNNHTASPPVSGFSPPSASPHSPTQDTSRWTPAKAVAFLKELGEGGNVARAARSVGMSRKAAYALRARAPEFARLWAVAVEDAAHMREVEAIRRKLPHPLLARRAVQGEPGQARGRVTVGGEKGDTRGCKR